MSARNNHPTDDGATSDSREIEHSRVAAKEIKQGIKGEYKQPTQGAGYFMGLDKAEYAIFWFLIGFLMAWVGLLRFLGQ